MLPFNRPYLTGHEEKYILDALQRGNTAAHGYYTRLCEDWLEHTLGVQRALLTNSCTAALEMAALLIDIEPGDEVIMPSFTYPSTANAFMLRGAVPVFVDINPATLNIDENLIANAITPRTRAIVVVHYAGMSCDMDKVAALCRQHSLFFIEDAAQAMLATYKGKPLGSLGDIATLSFHGTKNIQCGEGGALLLQKPELVEKAEQILHRGTNKESYLKGLVEKYEWTRLGVSALLGETSAAFLWAQLEQASLITQKRQDIWRNYAEALEPLAANDQLQLMHSPPEGQHNGHLFWVCTKNRIQRKKLTGHLASAGIETTSHYQPLHTSLAAKQHVPNLKILPVTEQKSACLIRLPLWPTLARHDQETIAACLLTNMNGVAK